ANTFDALITDPPSGTGFMRQAWDSDRGGRKRWCAWLTEIMREALRVLKPGAHGLVWAMPRRSNWTTLALEDAGFEIRDCIHHYFLSGNTKSLDVGKKTAKLVADAKEWVGWGTGLKPAIEHWWLVRKPLCEKTVAQNVLQWGTGALNIDASRIPLNQPEGIQAGWNERYGTKTPFPEGATSAENVGKGYRGQARPADPHPDTRYPSHFIVSNWELLGDHTGFFHPPIYSPKARKCRGEANDHRTVKPVELMKYFATLLTRPGGHVLDCFMGSGTTGVACRELGLA